ncbi:hypothetical protein FGE12_18365 [Aggregicoccus sp. 17bor-14]|uniref:hypothetical protein n=1 Tax=Myxococcaceae TaxID=31 RepID=UPI00129C65F5|nr:MULTISPECIES: hypothetical protein [Myxococcaceae]MBF5044369.1 hypothetical protein [Simulacricoccus sp. 17bor-14]MRI90116.1 hypothetical protein [Aggregicoccus sp. 17bor-14]
MAPRSHGSRQEPTRVEWVRRPPVDALGLEARGSARERLEEARLVPAALEPDRVERIVLVAHTFARDRAPELLAGLCAPQARAAHGMLQALAPQASAGRQALVAQAFGPVPEAPTRLRRLMEEASAPMQAELLRRLPPYYRSLFPAGAPPRAECTCPAMGTLAERLVREASR